MRKTAIVLILISALILPTQASAATAKAGAKCTKLKSTQVVGTKKFTCIKSGKKLVWDKGVAIPKVVVKKAQTIEFPPIENVFLANKALKLSNAATTAGLPVTYSAAGACSYDLATNSIILNSIGSCSVTTSQAGDANYLPAESITITFEIKKVTQEITPVAVSDQDLLKASAYSIAYPTFGSSSPVVMASKTQEICSIDGTNILYLKVGQCQISFNKAGDTEYESAKEVEISFKIFLSAQPGEKGNPVIIGTEATRNGVAITLDGINEGVSAAVCEADSANKGCVDKNGVGIFQPAAGSDYDHYVEVLLSIVNNSSKVWIADNLTLQLSETRKFPKNTVYTIDSLDGLELEPGDGISGSYFVLLPPDVDHRDVTVIYGTGIEAETFYFKVK
jgi:hypothetical protein